MLAVTKIWLIRKVKKHFFSNFSFVDVVERGKKETFCSIDRPLDVNAFVLQPIFGPLSPFHERATTHAEKPYFMRKEKQVILKNCREKGRIERGEKK